MRLGASAALHRREAAASRRAAMRASRGVQSTASTASPGMRRALRIMWRAAARSPTTRTSGGRLASQSKPPRRGPPSRPASAFRRGAPSRAPRRAPPWISSSAWPSGPASSHAMVGYSPSLSSSLASSPPPPCHPPSHHRQPACSLNACRYRFGVVPTIRTKRSRNALAKPNPASVAIRSTDSAVVCGKAARAARARSEATATARCRSVPESGAPACERSSRSAGRSHRASTARANGRAAIPSMHVASTCAAAARSQ
ncbi:O-acetylhomoserine aminocarboxypropyltransferase/cysteine synthase family protein [Burkholderia pseudomallei]|nr:O-acetylhomoserine aminocarboxypropyltransferase/cysteine synthase family protein [Burkholderia pseudomallei]